MAQQPTLINSVVRALDLLDAVGAAETPQPAKKLARTVGIPLPTAYHLLRTLVHEGYLHRTAEGYVLGDRIDALAQGAPPRRARQVLQQLHEELGAATYLSSLVDGQVRLTEIVDSPEAPRVDLWVGFHDAAHATALGKAVLGALPPQAQREYLAEHPLVDLTPHTLTSRRRLLHELSDFDGIAVDHEEYLLGAVCIAVSVPGRSMAVAASVPTHRAARLLARTAALQRAAHLVALAAG